MNLRTATYFIAVLLLACGCSLYAGTGKGYYLSQHITGDNGLPQNSIKSIAPDRNGFIWLATESALVRYDGHKLKTYNKENFQLLSSRFTFLLSDAAQRLYAVTEPGQALEIKGSRPYRSNKMTTDIVKPMIPPSHHTSGKIGDFAFYHQAHDDIRDSFQIVVTRNESVLLCNDNSLRWNSPSAPAQHFSFPLTPYRFIVCNSTLYYLRHLSPDGLLRITPQSVTPATLSGYEGKPAPNPFHLYLNDATGDAFLLADEQLYLIKQRPDRGLALQLLFDDPLLKTASIRSLYYDSKADRIFIGTSVSGLYIFERKLFNTKTATSATTAPDAFFGQSQSRNVFYGQTLADEHTIITGKGYQFREQGPTEYLPLIGKHVDEFGSVIQRYRDRTILTGNRKQLSRLTPDGRKLLSSWDLKSSFHIHQGYNDILWLGTENEGLYYFYPDSMQAPRQLVPLQEYITCMRQESENLLWVGTTTNLYRLHLDELKWDTIAPLHNKSIRSFYSSDPQTTWITTYEDGLYLWQRGRITKLPMDKNGFLKNAHCIMEDRQHYFWITTNNGLFQAAKSDLLRFAAGQQKSVYYHHYTKEKGFNTNEFNGGGCEPCGLKFNNGNSFSFPSLNGLVWFDPESIRPVLPGNSIILDGVQIDGNDMPVGDTIRLSKASGRINLWLATAYFGNNNNLCMEYKIEGPGTDSDIWNTLVNDFISFNGPQSGMFVLTVRKLQGFGPDSYVYKKIYIYIPKAFWETWWFILLLLLCITTLVFFLIKIRVHLLERKNKELEDVVSLRTQELRSAILSLEHAQLDLSKEVQFQRQLNASITHDIKTPIQYLNLSLKYLFLRKQREKASDADEIGEIFQATERIFHFTNSLTGYVKVRLGIEAPTQVLLHDTAQRKIEMFAGAALKAGNIFRNNIPKNIKLYTHAALLDIILHNLIDNANKHTQEGTVTIDTIQQLDSLSLCVTDTGRGMSEEQATVLNQFFSQKTNPPEHYPIGLGFLTIADTLEWIKAGMTISSQPGKGTRVCLKLKLPPSEND